MLYVVQPMGDDSRMCKCIRDWVPDDEVEGPHELRPVTCEQYIASLESILHNLMKSSADSLSMVLNAESRTQRQAVLAARGGDSLISDRDYSIASQGPIVIPGQRDESAGE